MQSCIVIQPLLYPSIYINENSHRGARFNSQIILVLSKATSYLIECIVFSEILVVLLAPW